MKQLYTKVCYICNQEFSYLSYVSQEKRSPKKTCSWECHILRLKGQVGDKNPAWKPINERASYRTLKTTLRKRLISSDTVCEVCNLPSVCFEIHHVDKNRNNNVLSNLMVLCLDCHADKHKGEKAERLIRGSKNHSHNIARPKQNCPQCKNVFYPYYDTHKFCSRKCSKNFRDEHTPSKLQTTQCKKCGSPFIHKPSIPKKYCSCECFHKRNSPIQ